MTARRTAAVAGLAVLLSAAAGVAGQTQPAAPAQVKKHPIDIWLEQCTAKDESTLGQTKCLGEAYEKWDAELNRVYKALAVKLPEAGRAALKTAQLAWLKFRDEEFNYLNALYDPLQGSMYRVVKAADRVDVVRKRALELQSYLDILEQI